MSATAVENMMLCASCGTAGSDDIQLKRCNGCYLVRYCGVKCQREHRPKHKKDCKKRAAELRDEILFKQPESSHLGDCPICCLPVPIDVSKSSLNTCCCKIICEGCACANGKRERERRLQLTCPFCRAVAPKTEEEFNRRIMKRIEVNDPVAITHIGKKKGNEGDFSNAFQYFKRAADLGDAEAHHRLSILYKKGQGVEKDEKRALHHAEQAALVGHPEARHNLGYEEMKNGRSDRGVKHYIIAAKLGDDNSLDVLKEIYKAGLVSKEDFTEALRGHHAAIKATKSPQREAAYEFTKRAESIGKR